MNNNWRALVGVGLIGAAVASGGCKKNEEETPFTQSENRPKKDPLVEEAQKRLQVIRTTPGDPSEAASQEAHIIADLCQKGLHEDAWSLLDNLPGLLRRSGISSFFSCSDISLPSVRIYLQKLKTPEDRAAGFAGYWRRFKPSELAVADISVLPPKTDSEKVTLRQVFLDSILTSYDKTNSSENADLRADLLKGFAALVTSGLTTYSQLEKLVKESPDEDGFAQWAVLQTVDSGFKSKQSSYDGAEATAIRRMAKNDGLRTNSSAIIMGSPEAAYLHIAFAQWLGTDEAAASTWYESRKTEFDNDQLDRLAMARVRFLTGKKDYVGAVACYQTIRSTRWKNSLNYEKKIIEKALPAVKFAPVK